MSEWQEILGRGNDAVGPGQDFEARVFAKIRRKKRQRRVGLGITAAAAVATLLVLFNPFRSGVRQEQLTAEKTEIPVSENLFFSTADSRTRYLLQPVALAETPEAQESLPDQI